MANGLAGKEKARLGFPEEGQPDYLAETLKLGMWRQILVERYRPRTVNRLIATAEAKAKEFYSHGLHSLETLAKANR